MNRAEIKPNGMNRNARQNSRAREKARQEAARKAIVRISGAVLFIGFLAVFGIVGGIENGEPLKNALLCGPVLAVVLVAARIINRFFED